MDNIVATLLPLSADDTTTSISVAIISPNVATQGNVQPPFALPSHFPPSPSCFSFFLLLWEQAIVINVLHDPYILLCAKTIEDLSMKMMFVDREEKRSKACIQYVVRDAQNCKLTI